MAYDYDDNEKKSVFNAGVALAERLDGLQRAINMARFNPLKPNPETMTYGYEIMVSSNDALQNEGWSKFTKDERKEMKRIRFIVHEFVEHFPPITIKENKAVINKENYEKLMALLDFYEKKNKEFLDNHDLNSPNKDNDEDDDYDY